MRQRGRFEAGLFAAAQHRPPEVVEEIQHQPGARVRGRLQPFQHRLDVGQIVHKVGEQDVIKLLRGGKLRRVGHLKFESRMPLARARNHRRAEIHTQPARRLDGRQEVPEPAPQFQHPQPRRHPKSVVTLEQSLVVTPAFPRPQRRPLLIEPAPINHRAMLLNETRAHGELEKRRAWGLERSRECARVARDVLGSIQTSGSAGRR